MYVVMRMKFVSYVYNLFENASIKKFIELGKIVVDHIEL